MAVLIILFLVERDQNIDVLLKIKSQAGIYKEIVLLDTTHPLSSCLM